MKAVVIAFLVVLVAIAAAQNLNEDQSALLRQESKALAPERSYVNKVEYVDQLTTAPNPELVPKYFVESHRSIRRKLGRGLRKIGRGARSAVRKARKAARKAAKKAKKLLARGGRKARRAARKAARKARKLARKARKGLKRLTKGRKGRKHHKKGGKHHKKGHKDRKGKLAAKRKLRKMRKAMKAQKRALKKTATRDAKKLAKQLAKRSKKSERKYKKHAKHTDRRIKKALNKLHHLSTAVSGLRNLMTRVDTQVQKLIPENRIRKYAQLDPSKFSNSGYGKTFKGDPKKLVNPYIKKPTGEVFYNKQVVDPALKVIRKDDDMNAQDLALDQQNLSKFTHKLARKDTVSLV